MIDRNEKRIQTLRDLAYIQAQLIWSRYNAMIVANAVLIGFIGQLALSSDRKPITPIVCGLGLFLTLIWWRITSVGWSLMHAWLEAIPKDNDDKIADTVKLPEKVYKDWVKGKFWLNNESLCQDSIWWCAHGVIALFYLAYFGFYIYFTYKSDIVYFLILPTFLLIILLISSIKTFNIHKP